MLASVNELYLLAAIVAAALLITAAVALTLGRRLARRHRRTAVLLSGLIAPLLPLVITIALNIRDGDIPGDGHALATAGSFMIACITAPFTVTVAALILRRRGANA